MLLFRLKRYMVVKNLINNKEIILKKVSLSRVCIIHITHKMKNKDSFYWINNLNMYNSHGESFTIDIAKDFQIIYSKDYIESIRDSYGLTIRDQFNRNFVHQYTLLVLPSKPCELTGNWQHSYGLKYNKDRITYMNFIRKLPETSISIDYTYNKDKWYFVIYNNHIQICYTVPHIGRKKKLRIIDTSVKRYYKRYSRNELNAGIQYFIQI